MKRNKTVLTILIASMLLTSTVVAGRIETADETVESEGAKKIAVEIDFGVGELFLKSADMDDVAKISIEYDSRKFRYDIDYSTRGDLGRLFLESTTRRSHDIDDADNEWNVTLSTRYPTELEIDMGACEAEIDLGGIPLVDLNIDVGAAAGLIDFSKPNPERLEELSVDVGASSVEMTNLGNANFEYFEFSSGASSSDLDFRGDYKGESEVSLDIGVGSAKIILPKGLAVRIETDDDNWFSSVDFHNDDLEELRNGVFESENFENAKDRMIIEVDVGMGSIDFYWK